MKQLPQYLLLVPLTEEQKSEMGIFFSLTVKTICAESDLLLNICKYI